MKQDIVIYHGSQQIVEVPQFGIGKKYNDYGQGFYCTESSELAKEWACPVKNDGYSNKYHLSLDGLNVMHLTQGEFNILNWIAVLLAHRKFDITSPIGNNAREFILNRFMPETADVDVMIGYRADDSYFAYAESFLNNTISVQRLSEALKLGNLGEQVVLMSEKAFGKLKFLGYEIADAATYYPLRKARNEQARMEFLSNRRGILSPDDLYLNDIIRGGIEPDDPRLQ